MPDHPAADGFEIAGKIEFCYSLTVTCGGPQLFVGF